MTQLYCATCDEPIDNKKYGRWNEGGLAPALTDDDYLCEPCAEAAWEAYYMND